jgi:hypothetical protein
MKQERKEKEGKGEERKGRKELCNEINWKKCKAGILQKSRISQSASRPFSQSASRQFS